METVRAVLARAREHEGEALVAAGRATPYTHRDIATGAWKAGNLLAHYGVGAGRPVAVAVGPKTPGPAAEAGRLGAAADPLLAMLGAMAAGGAVAPVRDGPVDAAALVAPAGWLDRFEPAPGTAVLAYGGPPADPAVAHFERERWSENPVEPPEPVAPADPALRGGAGSVSNRALVGAARDLAAEHGLGSGGTVRLAARVTSAGGFAAGVLAPLVAGATVRPVADADLAAGEAALRIGDGDAASVAPGDVL